MNSKQVIEAGMSPWCLSFPCPKVRMVKCITALLIFLPTNHELLIRMLCSLGEVCVCQKVNCTEANCVSYACGTSANGEVCPAPVNVDSTTNTIAWSPCLAKGPCKWLFLGWGTTFHNKVWQTSANISDVGSLSVTDDHEVDTCAASMSSKNTPSRV